jgi:glycosyltransferase involved in cell wall biosynthesis
VKWLSELQRGNTIQIITGEKNPDLDPAIEQVSFRLKRTRIPLLRQVELCFDILRVRQKIVRFSPKFIHVHYLLPHPIAYALPKRVPLVSSLWGSDIVALPGEPFDDRKMKYLQRYLSRSSAITVTSPYLAEVFRRMFRGKYGEPRVIPFSIDTKRFAPLAQPENHSVFTLGFAKTLFRHYGLEDLLVAIAPWAHTKQLHLYVTGDGPAAEEKHYRSLVATLHIEDLVTFLGRIKPNDMPNFYHKLDAFVIPSYREAFGVAALEASACEIPVVGTNIGGLREVIRNGETGFLVERGDYEEIRNVIRTLLTNSELRKNMGRAGRKFVQEKYELSQSVRLMEEVYRNVTA